MNNAAEFTNDELLLLKQIAGRIIPAAPDDDLPGADDEKVFAELLEIATANIENLRKQLQDLAVADGGINALITMDTDLFDRWFLQWAERWPENAHPFFALLMPMLLRAYYRDPRVHAAYGRRPGAPFPEGYVLIDGDWSLLDKVRDRPPFYRS